MPGYISEFKYYGQSDQEFVEIALPAGTDPSGYSLVLYMSNGQPLATFPLGNSTGTMNGHDVYVIDESTPGFSVADSMGTFYADDGLALIDDDGDVVQFVSWEGHTVTATNGPAAGETSTSAGNINAVGESMQSDDGGNTYYAQSSNNKGSIPACYAPGTLIDTPTGPVKVEDLKPGDEVACENGHPSLIRWIWSGTQPLDDVATHQKPVLIRKGTLGQGKPEQDLIVSGQHRIAVGTGGQLENLFAQPSMVPAKALTCLPGIRFMAGKKSISWHHFLCSEHMLVRANGAVSESLLLGAQVTETLTLSQRDEVMTALGPLARYTLPMRPALPCLTVRQARRNIITCLTRRTGTPQSHANLRHDPARHALSLAS